MYVNINFQYSQLFNNYSPLFTTIHYHLSLFVTIYDNSMTICHYSYYSRLFAICYSGFPDTPADRNEEH